MSRTPQVHYLKLAPEYFDEVQCQNKQFELRKDDRDYQVGDFLILNEYEKGHFTGRQYGAVKISYILKNCPQYGLMRGYCIIGW